MHSKFQHGITKREDPLRNEHLCEARILPPYSADDNGVSQKCSYFPDIVSVSKICTSVDLHRSIRGPALQHPRTCIAASKDLHCSIRGPASHHLWTCIRPLGPASFYRTHSGQLKRLEENLYNC